MQNHGISSSGVSPVEGLFWHCGPNIVTLEFDTYGLVGLTRSDPRCLLRPPLQLAA